MTIYAASSIDYVAVSIDGHGGCGKGHSRPVVNGAPQNPWALSCPPCENHLRHDPLWSATLTEIPETHDEKAAREDYQKRGANDVNTLLAVTLARLTGGEIPETVANMITGAGHGAITAKMVCPDGHENPPGKKFCGDCGATMHQGVTAIEAPAPPPAPPVAANGHANGNGHAPGGWEPPRNPKGQKKPMRDWKLEDLRTYAGMLGVDPGGDNRTELVDRLRAAKKAAVPA